MAEAFTAAWYTAVFCVIVVTVVLLKLKDASAPRRDDDGDLRKNNLPPGPWTLPVIGSMYCLLGALPHHALHRLARRYGPVMLLRLGHVSTLVVSSPEAAREVMKTQDAALANRPVYVTMNIFTYGGQNIALSPYTSTHWKELRRLCATELLSPRRVLAFRPVREEEAASLVAAVMSSSPTPVNVSEKVRLMMNDIIMRAILGNRSPQREAYLHEMGNALKLLAGFNLIDLFPASRLAKVIGGRSLREARQVHARLDRIVKSIIHTHAQAIMAADREKEDLLHILLRLQKDGGLKTTLTTDVISSTLFELFSAGSETTMTTITWAMSELMRNPQAMERAQAEVRQLLQGKNKVREEGIEGRLHYLQMVIKETLRLHPPVPMLLPRLVAAEGEPCQIMGFDIPPGTTVLVNAWAIGRDENSWDNATEFRPERFQDGVVDFNGADFRFLPGGAGRRMCPGLMFGLSNIELTLATLLYHFDWKLPNGESSTELDMSESQGITAHRKTDLWLEATPYVPTDAHM
ncbi:hypothetical protein PR202_gb03700 [Eleusine coracana subsp. coracana]|uniref:Uncharacterized protein n=1 Tax=Eleusine coracana subsp. coracana TaxID=191504 RepID=A0AAV5E1L4_ELECO|nr:hypothetical protein PR202_gb03700 [Eleusine coracana subsp. coracana]